jgi:hypothetical protein
LGYSDDFFIVSIQASKTPVHQVIICGGIGAALASVAGANEAINQ